MVKGFNYVITDDEASLIIRNTEKSGYVSVIADTGSTRVRLEIEELTFIDLINKLERDKEKLIKKHKKRAFKLIDETEEKKEKGKEKKTNGK